jgi:transposase
MRTHPGVELVCRDRAGAYAEAVRTAAPNATQVADRWHLWHNLLQAVEKTVIAERGALQAPEPDPQPESKEVAARPDSCPAEQPTTPLEGRLVIRTRQRYAAVQRLVAAGRSISAIGKELGLQRKTLRRFAFADSLDELLTTATTRGSLLDPFKPYLHQRFNAGHTDAARLTREITALGYRGSDKTVRRYLQPFRETLAATSPAPVPPSVRQVTGWLTCHPDRLTDDDRVQLKQVLARSDMLTITHQQVHDFAELLTQRRGEHLHGWMCDVDARGAAPLRSFTKGLRTDLAAVAAGLTIPYSSGPVEGAITHPQRAAARPVAIRHRTFPIWALHVGAPHN